MRPEGLDWERLQRAILARTLAVLAPLTGVLALLAGRMGAPAVTAWAAAALMAAMLWLLARRPRARRAVAWALAGMALGFQGFHVLRGLPVSVPILAALPSLAVFLDGLAMGGALLVGSAWIFARLFTAAAGNQAALDALVSSAGVGFFMATACVGWSLGLRRARGLLDGARVALRQEAQQRARLVQAIYQEVVEGRDKLEGALAAPSGPDWEAARRLLAQEAERGEGLRQLRNSFLDPALAAPPGSDFSVPVLRSLLALLLGMGLLSIDYLTVQGHGPALTGPLLTLFCVGGLLALRGKVQAPSYLAWLLVLSGLVAYTFDLKRDWGTRMTPTQVVWCAQSLNAGLLLGWRSALGLLALAFITALVSALALPFNPELWLTLAGLMFAYGLVGLICLQAVLLQRAVLERLEAERALLAAGLVHRRRLLGTLFHDIANPLAALSLTAELEKEGQAEPGDLARCLRLLRNLKELLDESRGWLLDGDGGETQAVALDRLLEGIPDLFAERLRAKGIALRQDVPPGLAVLAQAAALRDSVVGNLLSNAIKFSPPGHAIEIQARCSNGHTCIEISDRGPGLSPELRKRLNSGTDLPSLAGTAGEPGLGLGLGLAREHIKRMGGELAFVEREGGGLVARACLEAA